MSLKSRQTSGDAVRIFDGLCGLTHGLKPSENGPLGLKVADSELIWRKIPMTNPHKSSKIRTTKPESAQSTQNPHGRPLHHGSQTRSLHITQRFKVRRTSLCHNLEKRAYLAGWGRIECRPFRHQNHKSLENGRFWITREKRNLMEYTPFRPQPRENGPISRLCAPCISNARRNRANRLDHSVAAASYAPCRNATVMPASLSGRIRHAPIRTSTMRYPPAPVDRQPSTPNNTKAC